MVGLLIRVNAQLCALLHCRLLCPKRILSDATRTSGDSIFGMIGAVKGYENTGCRATGHAPGLHVLTQASNSDTQYLHVAILKCIHTFTHNADILLMMQVTHTCGDLNYHEDGPNASPSLRRIEMVSMLVSRVELTTLLPHQLGKLVLVKLKHKKMIINE